MRTDEVFIDHLQKLQATFRLLVYSISILMRFHRL